MFLGYAKNSIAYRFLVIKSGVADVNVNTVIESSDATFFENIFPMKRDETPSDNMIPYPIPEPVVPSETPDVENNSEECVPRRSKRQRREKSFGNDFAVFLVDDEPRTLLEAFASPDAYYWKEVGQVKWIQSLLMELGKFVLVPQVVSQWDANGFLKGN